MQKKHGSKKQSSKSQEVIASAEKATAQKTADDTRTMRQVVAGHFQNIGQYTSLAKSAIETQPIEVLAIYSTWTAEQANTSFGQKVIDCVYSKIEDSVSDSAWKQKQKKRRETVADVNKEFDATTLELEKHFKSTCSGFSPFANVACKEYAGSMKKLGNRKTTKTIYLSSDLASADGHVMEMIFRIKKESGEVIEK